MYRFVCTLVLLVTFPALGDPIGPMPMAIEQPAPIESVGSAAPGKSDLRLGTVRSTGAEDAEIPEAAPAAATGWITSTALPLLGVLTLILGLAYVFRRVARARGGVAGAMGAGGHAPSGVLSVLGRYPVGGGLTLVLIQLDRRVLLVAHSPGSAFRGRPGGMSLLTELTDEEDVASLLVRTQDERGESMSKRFNALLHGYSSDEDPLAETVVPSIVDEMAGDEPTAELSPLRERLDSLMRRVATTGPST